MWTLLISCFIPSFLDIEQKNQKPVFSKFQIVRLLILHSDWLTFIHFSGYKHKIRLVSRIRKREDQALISISTILKFSELGTLEWDTFNPDCLIQISNVDTFNFLLNPLFSRYSTEKSKTGFAKLENLSHICVY